MYVGGDCVHLKWDWDYVPDSADSPYTGILYRDGVAIYDYTSSNPSGLVYIDSGVTRGSHQYQCIESNATVTKNGNVETVNVGRVSGIIRADTTLTPAGNPHVLCKDISSDGLKIEATLTIQPGVEIIMEDNASIYGGRLMASGSSAQPIIITANVVDGGSYIQLGGNDSYMDYCVVDDIRHIRVLDSPTISNCTISHNIDGIYIDCNAYHPKIVNNLIHNNSQSAVNDYGSEGAVITGNIIEHNPNGVYFPYRFTITDISTPTITDNIFRYNGDGIDFWSDYVYPVAVSNNQFYDNIEYGLSKFSWSHYIDATNNWWGSADGPGGVGPGSGDNVSGNVLYDPWIGKVVEEENTSWDDIEKWYKAWGESEKTWPDGTTDKKALEGPSSGGARNNFWCSLGDTECCRFSCVAMQWKVLYFLNDLKKTGKLQGWDYMPVYGVCPPLYPEHNAVVIWQKGEDWGKDGIILDPHGKQRAYSYSVKTKIFSWKPVNAYEDVYPGIPGGSAAVTDKYKLDNFDNNPNEIDRWGNGPDAKTPWQSKGAKPPETSGVAAEIDCPVDVLIVNSKGERLGVLENGSQVAEFEPIDFYFWMDEEGDKQWFFFLPEDTYKVNITGTGYGTFGLLIGYPGKEVHDYGGNLSIGTWEQAILTIGPEGDDLTLANGSKPMFEIISLPREEGNGDKGLFDFLKTEFLGLPTYIWVLIIVIIIVICASVGIVARRSRKKTPPRYPPVQPQQLQPPTPPQMQPPPLPSPPSQ